MKTKLFLCIATTLFAILIRSQLPTVQVFQEQQTNYWNTSLSTLKQDSRYSLGLEILYDKVTPFSGLYTFNDRDNNVSRASHFKQALSEIYRASDKLKFESIESLQSRIELRENSQLQARILPDYTPTVKVGIINTQINYLNYDEDFPNDGGVKLENGVFVPNNIQPPLISKQVSIISPLEELVATSNNVVNFEFSLSELYQWGNKTIKNLTADFGNGIAMTVIENGQFVQNIFTVNYSELDKTQLLKFNITYSDNTSITTYAGISVGRDASNQIFAKGTSILKEHKSAIAGNDGLKGKIDYRIFFGEQNTDSKLRKPFIIVDGFDPGNKRRIIEADCATDPKCIEANSNWGKEPYESIETLMKYNNGAADLKDQLLKLNYDVIVVDFPSYCRSKTAPYEVVDCKNNPNADRIDGGADDIFRNGRTIASFIQEVNKEIKINGSSEKLVVVGPSMGGQITRYALAYMEKKQVETGDQNWNHNTRLWVSMDSPHQGATIPLAIQGDLYFMGELLGKDAAKTKYRNIINSKAARQMLLAIAGNKSNFYNSEHDVYNAELKSNGVVGSNGYPILNNIKKIAIANGSLIGSKNINPSEKFYEIAAFAKVRLFGFKVDNKPVFRLNNWFMPEKYTSNTLIQNFSYQPKKTLNWNLTNNLWMGSLDAAPGGNFNSANDLKIEVYKELKGTNAFSFPLSGSWYVIPILWTGSRLNVEQRIPGNIDVTITPQSFIPTHSALDTNGFTDWYQPINRNLVCSGQTPFDSYYGEENNMGHVTFTNNMASWLKEWLSGNNPPPPVYNNNSVVAIQGSKNICLNQNSLYSFNICDFPANPQWTATNASIIAQTNNSVTINSNTNGLVKLIANFPNSNIQPIIKKIWVGTPQFYVIPDSENTNYVTFHLESSNPEASLDDQGLTPTQVIWKRLDTGATRTGYTYFANGLSYNWSYDVEIKGTNSCGSYTDYTTITPPPPPNCDYIYRISNVQSNDYTIARIIDPICPQPYAMNRSLETTKVDETYDITVVNNLGNTIVQKKGKNFSLSSFPTGTYFVRIVKDNKIVSSQTLIKK